MVNAQMANVKKKSYESTMTEISCGEQSKND